MEIYVILSLDEPVAESVASIFPDADRILVFTGVWIVRSELVTTSDVMKKLGIQVGGNSGVVIAAKYYNGVASRDLVEKIAVWEHAK